MKREKSKKTKTKVIHETRKLQKRKEIYVAEEKEKIDNVGKRKTQKKIRKKQA